MDPNVQLASEILFDLVSSLEPRLKPLAPWYRLLVLTIDKWATSEGNQGVKRAKDILGQGWLSILGEEYHQLDYVSTVDGLPVLVKPLVDRVKGLSLDPRLLSATLSLVRVTDLWLGQEQDSSVQSSIEVIQNSKLPDTAKKEVQMFKTFVPLFFQMYPDHPITKAFNSALTLGDSDTVMYRESRGPNGPLTANAHKDVKTLMEAHCEDGRTLYDHIVDLQQEICNSVSTSFHPDTSLMEAVTSWDGYQDMIVSDTPGKISLIREKSGKIRTIAQPDYFSQVSLRPIHRWAENCLRSLDMDCTFDQRSSIDKIKQWHQAGAYVASFDQSSCTDLFPFEFQLKVLEYRFGTPLTEAVRTVMSDRDWSIKLPSGKTKRIRWSVGQPMGMLLSWPLMALSHHLLIQFCHWKSSGFSFSKKGPFDQYVICGDDVVIASRSVADQYLKTVKSLGMKVNLSKSHISGKGTSVPPVSEFAKITIWKGQPLFPIRPNMVLSSLKDWRQAVPLFIDISNVNGFNARLKHIERIIKKHYVKGRKFLIPLLTIPQELGGVGFRDSVSMLKKFDTLDTRQIHPWLLFLAHQVRSGLLTEQKSLNVDTKVFTETSYAIYREHPIRLYADQRESADRWMYLIDSRIPSVQEIALQAVTEGWGSYDRFLVPNENEVPPHERADRLSVMRTNWEKALGRSYYFPRESYGRVLLECGIDSFHSSLGHLLYDEIDPVVQLQYKTVVQTILAKRVK